MTTLPDQSRRFTIWEDDGVYIACVLDPNEAGSFDDKLRDLVREWIAIGKKCGGFLKLLAQNP
jgi:hypothetical protein